MVKVVTFRLDESYLDRLDKLAKKLKLENLSQTIRLALDEALAKYLLPGFKGDITTVSTVALDSVLAALQARIRELEAPKEQSYKEAAKAAKRVDELYKQNKRVEAEAIINERAKKGLWTGYAYWPNAKGELSPEEREKMLDERYPGRKKIVLRT